MTPEAQRISIAEACGYRAEKWASGCWMLYSPENERISDCGTGSRETAFNLYAPDYLADLNAMHAAVNLYRREKGNQFFFYEYQMNLFAVACPGFREDSLYRYSLCQFDVTEATAAQRAEAFLRTLGKWEDSK